MCALCGTLGMPVHWTENSAEADVRDLLVGKVLAAYGLSLRPWTGGGYIVVRDDGPSELVPSLHAVWALVERASGRPCDPFDPGVTRSITAECAA